MEAKRATPRARPRAPTSQASAFPGPRWVRAPPWNIPFSSNAWRGSKIQVQSTEHPLYVQHAHARPCVRTAGLLEGGGGAERHDPAAGRRQVAHKQWRARRRSGWAGPTVEYEPGAHFSTLISMIPPRRAPRKIRAAGTARTRRRASRSTGCRRLLRSRTHFPVTASKKQPPEAMKALNPTRGASERSTPSTAPG